MTDDIGAGPEPAGEIAALRQRVAWLEQSLARCGADLTQRAAELAHVNEIGQALAAQLDFQAFVDLVGAKIGAIFDAEVVYIALYARETGLIHFPYYLEDGERQLPESAALGQGLTSIVIQSRQPLLLGTFQQQLDLGVLTDGRPSESWLGVPIVVGERVTGAISVQSFLPDHFTDADVRLLSTLTANIGVALENARLFQAERDQVQRQAAIFRLSAESAAAADEGAICERLARGLLDQALGYAYVGVFLLDEASGERMLRASAGLPTNIAGLRLASGQGLSGRALLDGQLHYTPDVTVDAQYVPALNSGSEVDVPIKIGAAIAGVLVVESHHPNAFGQADFDVLTAVANQAGVALGRARSLAETRRRVTELVTINSISQALAAQLELGALIELVGENMRRIFDAQIVYVALLDRASGRVTFPYYIEDDQLQSYTSIEFGEGLTSRIIETRQPLLLNQAEHAEEIRTKGVGTPARSYLGVPIMVGDEAIGVISVQSTRREGMFGEAELRLLATIAANVGVAIQNARLYEETRRRANEMAALAEIGHDITTTTNLDPVLERIVAQAKDLLRVRDIALYLREQDAATFRAVVVLGQYLEEIKAHPAVLGRGIVGTIAQTGVAEVVNRPELDPRTVRIPGTPLPNEELEGLMCAPLLSRGQVIGLMAVWRPRAHGLFSQSDLDFLISVTRQAAIAIESARLYLETRRQANEMAALADVGRDVSATLDLPTVLERNASHARDLLAADTSAVFLAEPDGRAFRPIVALGADAGQIQAYTVPAGVGIIGDLARRGVAEVVNDTSRDPRTVCIPGTPHEGAEKLMVAPLMARRQVIGLMAVWRSSARKPFSATNLNFLVGLARQATIAIENARLFDEAQQARAAAEAANVAKSTFLANMSHELRTPLNAVLGFAQLMERDPALSSRQKEHLGIITRSGEHLLGLINDVLEMSKIEAGRVTLNEAPFDLRQLLASVEELFQLRAAAKLLLLRCDVAPEVPHYVVGDESKLRQVLINLLGNAVKFTHDGGVTLRVAWRDSRPSTTDNDGATERRGDGATITRPLTPSPARPVARSSLVVEVEDTGEGIVDDQLAHLFQPFRQTASGIRAQEGTGLGLSISRQFVRLMGGDIRVRSAPGQGTLFRFDVQLAPAAPAELPPGPAERRVIGIAPGQRTEYRMLVVDDKRENRQLLVEWLRGVGFAVREAANGQEAIDEWQRWAPHMIWMDLRMPVMDGYEATRRIKSSVQGQATVVIALTASAFEHEQAIVLSSGCDDFVRKPVREATVFERIVQHLGVQFLYDEPPPAAALDQAIDLSPASLTALPASWLASLQQAADEVDTEMANAVIAQIREYDAPLADGLADLVASYRFDKLQTLIQEVSAHHDSVKHS